MGEVLDQYFECLSLEFGEPLVSLFRTFHDEFFKEWNSFPDIKESFPDINFIRAENFKEIDTPGGKFWVDSYIQYLIIGDGDYKPMWFTGNDLDEAIKLKNADEARNQGAILAKRFRNSFNSFARNKKTIGFLMDHSAPEMFLADDPFSSSGHGVLILKIRFEYGGI